MKRSAWSKGADGSTVARRAAGRRAYNAHRQWAVRVRRLQVLDLVGRYGRTTRGVQARIAHELGVSRATVCRDWHAVWDHLAAQTCPCCGYNRALGLRICFHGPHEEGTGPA